jgi:hypothetical protein
MEGNDIVGTLGSFLELLKNFGILYVISGLLLVWGWMERKQVAVAVKVIIIWAGNRLSIYQRSAANAERIIELQHDLEEERKRCDEQMAAMKQDYQYRIDVMNDKIDKMGATILEQATTLARIEERLKAAQTVAEKSIHKTRGKA